MALTTYAIALVYQKGSKWMQCTSPFLEDWCIIDSIMIGAASWAGGSNEGMK